MPLTCSCSGNYNWYYEPPEFYQLYDQKKRKRCCSCKELINIDSYCGRFECYKVSEYGEDISLAPKYMCETCTDLFFTFESLGYCIELVSDNMKELLIEYQDMRK